MLVLSRREGQQIQIGNGITITVVRCSDGKASIGVDAPKDMLVLRAELEGERKETHRK